jgi:hypothetical protein
MVKWFERWKGGNRGRDGIACLPGLKQAIPTVDKGTQNMSNGIYGEGVEVPLKCDVEGRVVG